MTCVASNRQKNCLYSLNIHKDTPMYVGLFILLVLFPVGQTIHYFCLEEQKARELKAKKVEESGCMPLEESTDLAEQVKEEKDRREKLAYGISTDPYIVEEGKTPAGRVTTVLEKRRAVAPPLTPAYGAVSINGLYESRTKTVQKEEALICKVQVTADKWGRGPELISLINDTDVPPSLVTSEEKAKYSMELVQQHVEKMTEQKVLVLGLLEEKTRLVCCSEGMEMFSETRFELKLEMTAPVHLIMDVCSVKLEPTIEQQKTGPPLRVSERTSIPNKETPRGEVAPTPRSHKKGKSTVSSLEEKQQVSSSRPVKVTIPSQEKRERRDSSKGVRKTSDLAELVPLLQQVQQGQSAVEKLQKEKQRTPKESPMPSTPEKPSSGQMPPVPKKKKKEASSSQGSNSLPN